jgi:S-adenosylmethionine decarboxylase
MQGTPARQVSRTNALRQCRIFFYPKSNIERGVMIELNDKIRLYGFNNLTKTVSFNIYDVCYAKSEKEKNAYIAYIDEQYNSERLTRILCDVTEII